jgi:hypothetical protein
VLSAAGLRVLSARTRGEAERLAARLAGEIDVLVHDGSGAGVDAPGVPVLALAKPYTPERLRSEVRRAAGLT